MDPSQGTATIPVEPPCGEKQEESASRPVTGSGRPASSAATRLLRKLARMAPTLATSFVLFAVFVVQGVLLARMLEPEGRGEYAAVISYTRILTFIGLLGVNYAIVRRAAAMHGRVKELSRSAIRAGMLTGAITLLAVAVLSLVALPHGKEHLAWLSILCAMTLPLEHIRLNLNAVDQGGGQFARFNAGRLVAAAAFPLLLVVAWACGGISVTSATLLLIPATLLGVAFRMVWSGDHRPWLAGKPPVGTLVREGMPYAASQAVSDLYNKLDTLLVLWLATSAQQGLYAAAVPAVQVLIVVPEALAVFAFNAGARRDHRHGAGTILILSGGLLLFQLLAALLYSVVLGRLIVLVYTAAFAEAIRPALALLPGVALQGCTIVADGYLRGRGKALAGVHARLAGAAAMGLAALALHGPCRSLAIPLAVSVGSLLSAAWIFVAVVRDTSGNRSPVLPDALAERLA